VRLRTGRAQVGLGVGESGGGGGGGCGQGVRAGSNGKDFLVFSAQLPSPWGSGLAALYAQAPKTTKKKIKKKKLNTIFF
jgi:hypothetical protein